MNLALFPIPVAISIMAITIVICFCLCLGGTIKSDDEGSRVGMLLLTAWVLICTYAVISLVIQ